MNDYLFYKDRPLVKSEDKIYYGFVDDGIVVMMQIVDYMKFNEDEIPKNINLTLMSTGSDTSILRTAQKEGLTEALELADIWLTTEVDEKKEK